MRGGKDPWLTLRDWGYALSSTGRYTIIGVALFGGGAAEPADMSALRADEVTIAIEQ
jgi:hypothetical protein